MIFARSRQLENSHSHFFLQFWTLRVEDSISKKQIFQLLSENFYDVFDAPK